MFSMIAEQKAKMAKGESAEKQEATLGDVQ
jgi:hypothetical protein